MRNKETIIEELRDYGFEFEFVSRNAEDRVVFKFVNQISANTQEIITCVVCDDNYNCHVNWLTVMQVMDIDTGRELRYRVDKRFVDMRILRLILEYGEVCKEEFKGVILTR